VEVDLDSPWSSEGEEGGSPDLRHHLLSSLTFEKQKRNNIAPPGSIPASWSSSVPPDLWSGGGLWATSPGVKASQACRIHPSLLLFKVNQDLTLTLISRFI
jgi:hypothetical protein